LRPALPICKAEVVWAVRQEMARTVEDVLARRTRALFLDSRASMEAADFVARTLALELGKPSEWRDAQVREYCGLAKGYLLS
jgi:glycerol-3-phosphate dehydrogenase